MYCNENAHFSKIYAEMEYEIYICLHIIDIWIL